MREGKSRQLRNVVATGGPDGMQTIEMDLARLVTSGLVTMEMAQSICGLPERDPGPGLDARVPKPRRQPRPRPAGPASRR